MKISRHIVPALAVGFALLFSGAPSFAQDRPSEPSPARHHMMRDHRPYGGYCRGPRWGWYGARKPVRTEEEARRHLEKFFEEEDVVIGTITTGGRHFFADILGKDEQIVDRVIIDRRTGRIRSLY